MKGFSAMRGGLIGLAAIAPVALFSATAMAQTTPLRILTPQAKHCISSCEARAQSCYHHATSEGARENCEVNGSHCKRGC